MSGTWKWYGNGLLNLCKGNIDFDSDTFKIMLCTASYTPDQDAHDYRNDVTNEVSPSGNYAAGGVALQNVSVTYDSASNEVRIVWSPDPAFSNATITARTAVIYKSRGGASSADELVAYCTEATDITSTAGTFTIDLPTTAVLKITAA